MIVICNVFEMNTFCLSIEGKSEEMRSLVVDFSEAWQCVRQQLLTFSMLHTLYSPAYNAVSIHLMKKYIKLLIATTIASNQP